MTKYDHKFPFIKFIYLNCGYVTHYVFLCLAGRRAVKMFYFVEFFQLAVVHYINNRFSALVIGCYFYL